jgi:hypothetical protein
MNYIIAAAFVILCGQTVPEPMTLTDAVTYVDTHPKERFLTEKEVMALGLTKRVWSISSRCLTGGKCLAGTNNTGMEPNIRSNGGRYYLITATEASSCASSSTFTPESFEGKLMNESTQDSSFFRKSVPKVKVEPVVEEPEEEIHYPSGGISGGM